MQAQTTSRIKRTIEIPVGEFRERMSQSVANSEQEVSNSSSVYSRLALLHRVAKAYALEALHGTNIPVEAVEIDELTDPPIYEQDPGEDPVLISFSYPVNNFDHHGNANAT